MNRDTISAECAHGMHRACNYLDCCCHCHVELDALEDPGDIPYDEDFEDCAA